MQARAAAGEAALRSNGGMSAAENMMASKRDRRVLGAVLVLAAGCGDVVRTNDAGPVDGNGPRVCAASTKFGALVEVPGLSSASLDESTPRLSPDELTVYFTARALDPKQPSTVLDANLYTGSRATVNDAFTVSEMATLNSTSEDQDPSVSSDGLRLYYSSLRTPNEGYHTYLVTRGSTSGAFANPSLVANVDGADKTKDDGQAFATADGAELWFTSTRLGTVGGNDIWKASLTGAMASAPAAVAELNSASNDWLPVVSADRLTVYFSSNRPGSTLNPSGAPSYDIWTSHRSAVTEAFPAPTRVPELSTTADDFAGWLSSDNCRFYMSSIDKQGQHLDIFMATRAP